MKIRNILYTTMILASAFTFSACGGGGGGGGGGESAPSEGTTSTPSNLFLMRSEYNRATITINCSNFQGTFDCVKGGTINKSNSSLNWFYIGGQNGLGGVASYSTWSQENWNSKNIQLTLTINRSSGDVLKVTGLTLDCPNGNTSSSTVTGSVSAGASMLYTPGNYTDTLKSGTYTITYHN